MIAQLNKNGTITLTPESRGENIILAMAGVHTIAHISKAWDEINPFNDDYILSFEGEEFYALRRNV